MEGKEEKILLDGPEASVLLASGKNSTFSRTDSFSERLVRSKKSQNEAEDTRKFLNGKGSPSQSDNHESDEDGGSNHEETGEAVSPTNPKMQLTGWRRYLGMGLAICAS
ncbi:unnamed protein product, partial [Allacma fusca]